MPRVGLEQEDERMKRERLQQEVEDRFNMKIARELEAEIDKDCLKFMIECAKCKEIKQ